MDVGTPTIKRKGSISATSAAGQDLRAAEILSLIGEHMPTNSSSPLASYLPGFTSLRLMLMKTERTPREEEVLGTILESYSSYVASAKSASEIAWLLARDCMLLSQQVVPRRQGVQPQPSILQSQALNGLAAAAALPQVSNTFNPAQAPRQIMQSLHGIAPTSNQPLRPVQEYSLPQMQSLPGMPPAGGDGRQRNGQHRNGSLGSK